MIRHLKSSHNIIISDEQDSMRQYYLEYIHEVKGSPDIKCPYCDKHRKMRSASGMYDTCASKECIKTYSLRGINKQIEVGIGIHNLEMKPVYHKINQENGVYKRASKNGRSSLLINQLLCNKGQSKYSFKSMSERKFSDMLEILNIEHKVNVHISRGSGHIIPEDRKFFIYDIEIVNKNILIEIDGNYHDSMEVQLNDKLKEEFAIINGYNLFRIKNEDIFEGSIILNELISKLV
jgi:hypothetical protein